MSASRAAIQLMWRTYNRAVQQLKVKRLHAQWTVQTPKSMKLWHFDTHPGDDAVPNISAITCTRASVFASQSRKN